MKTHSNLGKKKKKACLRLPWQSSGYDWALLLLGPGSILGQGTKIPQDVQHGQKKEKEKENMPNLFFIEKAAIASFSCLTTLHVGPQFSDQALKLCAL